jgi:Flp pilus assembly pilin Flp
MHSFLTSLYVKVRFFRESNGQDLTEYALVAALPAPAATAGMNSVAAGINVAFTNVGAMISSYS